MKKLHNLVNVDELVDSLTLAEQVSLLAGRNIWETAAVDRAGIPSIRVTDGPVGARGTDFNGPASVNVPCGTSMAATFDPTLIEEVGHLLGKETLAKGARVLLAPTVNLHRTPVGGRNFECLSEDPYLTAEIAVAYVTGLQAEGVASCIKHFVGNDTEFERNTIDSRIDEKTLRELYLVPFEAAVEDADVLSVMTSYNRLNGPWAADSKELITDVLRGEWGFDGLVMSDWFGLNSMIEGIESGLDLEMPGPTRHRGQALIDAVEAGTVSADDVRRAARTVIDLISRVGGFDADGPGAETTRDEPEDRALVRKAGAAGMVLLQNRDSGGGAVLPLSAAAGKSRRVAILGPNAAKGENRGGGSAHVNPTHLVAPLAALRDRFEAAGVEVTYAPGCSTNRTLRDLDLGLCTDSSIQFFADPADVFNPAAVATLTSDAINPRYIWFGDPATGSLAPPTFGARISTTFTPDVTGPWQLGVTSVGRATVVLDGATVADNADVADGSAFFGLGRGEVSAEVTLVAGRAYHLVITNERHPSPVSLSGLFIGVQPPLLGDPMAAATGLAADSDLAIIIVGTNDDWESEGWDRDTIALPGQQDELIRRVAQVCPRTVVVVNAGSPVSMPWLDEVDAVLMAWFPGQEMGDSIADVMFGDVEPSGRLPVTFPRSLEDTPAFEHHPGRAGVAHYSERRLMGYRWYDTVGRDPLFEFGFGLGYGRATYVSASAPSPHLIEVTLRNDGPRDACEVVQVYARRLNRVGVRSDEPFQKLVGFTNVTVPAGTTLSTVVSVDRRAYREWNETDHAWVPLDGAIELRIGRSSRDVQAHIELTL
jgi:beta-glucosidase